MKELENPRKVSYICILKCIRLASNVLSLLLKVINLLVGMNNLFNL